MKEKLKVIAACQDPGGCNAILPVVLKMRKDGHKVGLFASLYSTNILKQKKIEFSEISSKSFNSVSGILEKEDPDLVLLGTSMGFSLEDIFVEACRCRGVPSLAIFDSWVNFSIRFRGPLNGKNLKYLPDYVCVSDVFVKEKMIEENIPEQRVIVTGNPYFDNLMQVANNEEKIKSKFSAHYGVCPGTDIFTFFSQRIESSFGLCIGEDNYLGYTQFDALKLLIDAIGSFYKGQRVLLIVRPHPKEKKVNYTRFQRKGNFQIKVSCEGAARELLIFSDIIAGMFSIMLVEAYILSKKILCIQPHLQREDPFILSRLGIVKKLDDRKAIFAQLKKYKQNIRIDKEKDRFSFFNTSRGANNVINLISDIIGSKNLSHYEKIS